MRYCGKSVVWPRHHQPGLRWRILGYQDVSSPGCCHRELGHLLGEVKEGDKLIFLADVGHDFPLIPGEVKTGWVVCTAMQDHHIALHSLGLKGFDDSLEVHSEGFCIEVGVGLALNATVNKVPYLLVVDPRGI